MGPEGRPISRSSCGLGKHLSSRKSPISIAKTQFAINIPFAPAPRPLPPVMIRLTAVGWLPDVSAFLDGARDASVHVDVRSRMGLGPGGKP